uniref:Putative secreted protein n=1 Tax=Anopheles marajoara TaxID=58244 RepID=A0A2M4CFR8_9DIPT
MSPGFMYPAFSAAAAAAAAAAGYQFPQMAQAGIPPTMTAIPTPQVSAASAGATTVVLNPYKKMKTS